MSDAEAKPLYTAGIQCTQGTMSGIGIKSFIFCKDLLERGKERV